MTGMSEKVEQDGTTALPGRIIRVFLIIYLALWFLSLIGLVFAYFIYYSEAFTHWLDVNSGTRSAFGPYAPLIHLGRSTLLAVIGFIFLSYIFTEQTAAFIKTTRNFPKIISHPFRLRNARTLLVFMIVAAVLIAAAILQYHHHFISGPEILANNWIAYAGEFGYQTPEVDDYLYREFYYIPYNWGFIHDYIFVIFFVPVFLLPLYSALNDIRVLRSIKTPIVNAYKLTDDFRMKKLIDDFEQFKYTFINKIGKYASYFFCFILIICYENWVGVKILSQRGRWLLFMGIILLLIGLISIIAAFISYERIFRNVSDTIWNYNRENDQFEEKHCAVRVLRAVFRRNVIASAAIVLFSIFSPFIDLG